MGVLNFAHASFYMLGAYFAYTISSSRLLAGAPGRAAAVSACSAPASRCRACAACTRTATSRAALHFRPRPHHRKGGADDLGPIRGALPRARATSTSRCSRSTAPSFPAYRGVHDADLRPDARRDLAVPDAHPHRPCDPGGAHPPGHGRRARPQRAARVHARVRRRQRRSPASPA